MLGFFQSYRRECTFIREDIAKRAFNAEKFGFRASTEYPERERIFGRSFENVHAAKGIAECRYLSLIKILSSHGIPYANLSFSEALIISESLICDDLRKAIFQIISFLDISKMIKARKYVFDESENPEMIEIDFLDQVKFDTKNMNYSEGLKDVLEMLEKIYETERENKKRDNKR